MKYERILPQALKAAIAPTGFYLTEQQGMKPPKRDGWVDGGLCPFHSDTNAGSFRIHTASGAFHCFACGASGGDILAFTQKRDGLSFRQALERLSDSWGRS